MIPPVADVLTIWRERKPRTLRDNAYLAYLVLVVAVTIVPIPLYPLWAIATGPAGIDILTSRTAPTFASAIVAVIWGAALLIGRARGPALLAPFPLYALTTSTLHTSQAIRGPVLRAGGVITALGAGSAAFVGLALSSQGMTSASGVVCFAAAGALMGLVTSVAWLAGQALPRASATLALGTWTVALLDMKFLRAWTPTPWGWVGHTYPSFDTPFGALMAMVLFTCALLGCVPTLLARLSGPRLLAQSVRWESAAICASGLDFSAAAELYERKPRIGRNIRVRRPGRKLATIFFRRGAVGACRAPGRLGTSLVAVAATGALLSLAMFPEVPAAVVGSIAGLVLFVGLQPLTDGMRHAARVAGDHPLYGVSDAKLVILHALFPAAIVLPLLGLATILSSWVTGVDLVPSLIAALSLGITNLLVCLTGALKGSMPVSFMTPLPTPVGDIKILMQMGWALEGVLLAGTTGVAAVLLMEAPLAGLLVAVIMATIGIRRWWNR